MINKLVQKIQQTNAPIVVGLDPMMNYIPEQVQQKALQSMAKLWKVQRKQSGSTTKKLLTRFMI